MIYLELFWSFLQIGLFSFGGGYASLPLIQKQVVETHHWLTMNEFIDIITISQMTPGPIAINAATFVGTRLGGLLGAIVATLGSVTPSLLIVLTIAYFYSKYKDLWLVGGVLQGLRPAVVALIASSALAITLTAFFGDEATSWLRVDFADLDKTALLIFLGALFVLRKFKLDPIIVMVISGVVGIIFYLP
ncbi:MAG: chromate transporter [Zhaonellaceae bacterium]|nr:chromate transporter [Clostridia bacterium]